MKKKIQSKISGFIDREWRSGLLLVTIIIANIYAPDGSRDIFTFFAFITYMVILYTFFGGMSGEDYKPGDYKKNLIKFFTIRKIIILLIVLVVAEIFLNKARLIVPLLEAYTCRNVDEGKPPVSSGCYDMGEREPEDKWEDIPCLKGLKYGDPMEPNPDYVGPEVKCENQKP